ncbi:hypothetical protein EWM64_g79 [Hericium alpestre]|uniref:PIN domain-containing protein n=1 Tax=Hericium alpestre TaxID=135208 RepID=A0A4Z0ABH2_9AGAM|nr:hypothetical protein EWM64_g79 [Hericium alpestre]
MSFTNGLQLPSFGSGPPWTPDPNFSPSFSLTNSPPHEVEDGPLVDATLRRLEAAVNEDVEMQGALSEYLTYLVMDTNVLLDKLDVLQQFVSDVEALSIPVIVIIPGIVISELDHQKNRPGLEWRARRASTWLLKMVKERRSVKGQAHEETCKRSGKWNVKDPGERGGPEANDDLILDCCEYFARVSNRGYRGRVVLCSSDKNLCFKSESKEIFTATQMACCSARKRVLSIVLTLLALILLGTVAVLSSVSYYLAIPDAAYITEQELDAPPSNNTAIERIPRIIHQTWKTETLPPRWKDISEECRAMMPDYEYMLWTDATSREFIAEQYSWFLDTFDSYTYPIQRADAIRYFVLHYYGGIYMDLDIGCLHRLDPLLTYPVILPRTIPVGVSNDLMFAEKGHPFLAQTIHNLVTFDHSWVLNYPTVMFSTGPMFLSAQYGIFSTAHPSD